MKKLISLLLCLCVIYCCAPISVLAGEAQPALSTEFNDSWIEVFTLYLDNTPAELSLSEYPTNLPDSISNDDIFFVFGYLGDESFAMLNNNSHGYIWKPVNENKLMILFAICIKGYATIAEMAVKTPVSLILTDGEKVSIVDNNNYTLYGSAVDSILQGE